MERVAKITIIVSVDFNELSIPDLLEVLDGEGDIPIAGVEIIEK